MCLKLFEVGYFKQTSKSNIAQKKKKRLKTDIAKQATDFES
jgi:hypothetical protein